MQQNLLQPVARHFRPINAVVILSTVVFAIILTSCGGGGSSNGGGGGGQIVGITVSPTSKTLGVGESTTFTATVTNTSNTSVYWLVMEGNNGGTVTSAGLYTAPNTAGTYHVVVTSQADTTRSATAVVTVSPPGTRTVSGSTIVTFHTTDTTGTFHTTDVPQNASSFNLAALVPNGSGGFTSIPGTGASDGTYSIGGVPAGYFWLTDGRGTFVWTQKNTVDTGIDYIGDSTVTIALSSASVSLSMSGASAWQTSDFAIFYSPNPGIYKRFFTSGAAGSTSLNDVIDLTSGPLMNSTKGDYAIIYQLVHNTVTGGGYKAVERFYSQPDPFSTPAGTQTQLAAAFALVPNNSTVHLSVNASQFAAFTPLMSPNATSPSTCLGLQALPSTASTGFSNAAGDVILADDCQSGTPILTDTDLGDISYGDPYPSNWPLFAEFVHTVSVPYKLPGTTTAYNAVAGNIAYDTTLPTSTAPIVPLVGPVLNPVIKAYGSSTSTPLQSGATGVGTSPVIAWDPPSSSFGTPTEYVVTITPLMPSSGSTVAHTATTLWVGGGVHSIQVPPGVMTTGTTYFIGISAVVATGIDAESSPYRRTLPYGQSDVLSGLITP